MELTRRGAMKSIGGTVLVGMSGAASGRRSRRSPKKNLFERSLEIHEQTGNPDKAEEFLVNRGFGVDTMEGVIGEQGGAVSAQSLHQNTFKIKISLFAPECHNQSLSAHLAKVSWTFDRDIGDPGGVCGHGTWGNDRIGITYKEGAWYIPGGSDGAYGGEEIVTKPENYTPNGMAFRWEDFDAVNDECADQPWYYCAAPLEPADENFNDGARQVWGVYAHQDNNLSGDLTISFGGLGYNGFINPIQWTQREDENGNDLIVNPTDAVTGCWTP